MKIAAPAKLNLSLRVLGRQMDGYHTIETLLLRLRLADEIDLEIGGEGIRFELEAAAGQAESGLPADPRRLVPTGETNLCWQAAARLFERVNRPPSLRIRLTKRIPAAAGLGGGSSDAASVLLGLNRLLGQPLSSAELFDLAGALGSDVPFFATETPYGLAWGRGQRVLRLPAPPSRPVLLLVPDFGVSAAEAYGWWSEDRDAAEAAAAAADLVADVLPDTLAAATDSATDGQGVRPSGAGILPWPAELGRWEALGGLAGNDLAAAVERRRPSLRRARMALEAAGAELALLCGSGSCVAGIFADEAARDAARERAAEPAPDGQSWSVISTSTEGRDAS
jgi:4-diphosphocytidyl-2-C-methyl-D-erythritol kinase